MENLNTSKFELNGSQENSALAIRKKLALIGRRKVKNILLVHNRKRLDKRKYIKGEDGNTVAEMRKSTDWYTLANKMCEQNYLNLFNPNYKSFTWDDVLKKLDRDRI